MKNLLRNWLEVPEIPDMSDYVKKDDIKEAVEDAIYEAMEPELPADYPRYWFTHNHKNIRGTLSKRVKKIVGESATCMAGAAVKELVEPESFIDGIVKRIKDKQLDA